MADTLFTDPTVQDQQTPFTSTAEVVTAEAPVVSPSLAGRLTSMSKLAGVTPEAEDDGSVSELLEAVGDTQLRMQAASEQQISRLNSAKQAFANNVGINEQAAQEAANLTQWILSEDLQAKEKVALEQEAVKKAQEAASQGDYYQARTIKNLLIEPDMYATRTDYLTKQALINSRVQELVQDKDEQGWLMDTVNFITGIVPLNFQFSRTGLVDTGTKRSFGDLILPGARGKSEVNSLFSLPVDQFNAALPGVIKNVRDNSTFFGYYNKGEAAELGSYVADNPSQWVTNSWSALDWAGSGVFGASTKIASGIGGMALRAGARKEAVNIFAKALDDVATEGVINVERKMGLDADDLTAAVMPKAMSPVGTVAHVSPGVDIDAVRANAKRVLDDIVPDLRQPGRFQNEAELEETVRRNMVRYENEYGEALKDYSITPGRLHEGSTVYDAELYLGRKSGGLYASKSEAQKAANRYGEGVPEQDESGGWAIKVTRPIQEAGEYSSGIAVKEHKYNPAARYVLGAGNLSDDYLFDISRSSGNNRSRFLKETAKYYNDNIVKKLNKKEHAYLEQVLNTARKNEAWFDDNGLDTIYQRVLKRNPSENERAAYYAYRNLSDLEYEMRNEALFKTAHSQGMETVYGDWGSFRLDDKNALVDRVVTKLPRDQPIYMVGDDVIKYAKDLDIDRLKSDGYYLVSTQETITGSNGYKTKFFLTKGKDVQLKPLNRVQLGYKPGGHIIYRDKYLVRRVARGAQPDGSTYLDNPHTYMIGTKAEANAWQASMERARTIYDGGKGSIDELSEHLDSSPGLPSTDEFIQIMKDEGHTESFVTTFDRELPEAYKTNPGFANTDEEGVVEWLRSTGQMYTGKRGTKRLASYRDWSGDATPILSPFDTIDKAVSNIANITSFSDYKITSVDRWVREFGKDLNPAMPGESLLSRFSTGTFNSKLDPVRRKAAEAQRDIIRRNIGWKTQAIQDQEQYTRKLAEWVFGDSPDGVRNRAAQVTADWTKTKNPLSMMRGLAFDAKLGFLNPGQLFLQMSSAISAVAISPAYGMRAMQSMAPVRAMLFGKNAVGLVDAMIEKGMWRGGFKDPAEFKEYMGVAQRTGFFNVNESHGLVNAEGASALDEAGNVINTLRRHGRFFFYEGELWNRIVAHRIAWEETKDRFPKLARDSDEFLRRVDGKAEDYTFGMSKESQAAWQSGFASIPTQFWSYQVRVMEAMAGIAGGGRLTRAQSARLILYTSLLYGSAATPVTFAISEMFKEHTGTAPGIDTAIGVADRGILDKLLYEATGADVKAGSRFAAGTLINTVIEDILGTSPYGKKSVSEFALGASGSIYGDLATALIPIIKYFIAESGGDTGRPLTEAAIKGLANNISTISNWNKMMMIQQYGVVQSNKGTVIAQDVPEVNALFQLFSIPPAQQDMVSAQMAYSKNKSKAIDEHARVISNFRVQFATQPERQEEIEDQLNAYVNMIPEEIRQQALKKGHRFTPKTVAEGLAERVERYKQQEETINGYQELNSPNN